MIVWYTIGEYQHSSMSKKIKKKSEPSLALALIALVAPVLTAGIAPSFAEGTTGHTSLLFDYSLFNPQEFLMQRRLRNAAPAVIVPVDQGGSISSAATVNPCDPTPATVPLVSVPSELTYDDLTSTERDTLRKQLRNHACPQHADPQYQRLCERMLRAMPAPETRTGLANPNQ